MRVLLIILIFLIQASTIFNSTEKTFFDDVDLINWYEGDGIGGCIMPTVSASSNLKSNKGIVYIAENANEGSLENAWIEGNLNYGIGESIEFVYNNTIYENHVFKINRVYIFNGYYKSKNLWEANSRVKKLNLFVNGIKLGTLNLLDTRNPQLVKLPDIEVKYKKDTKIKFEIADIYKGNKYKDTAITSFKFDGKGCN